MDQPVMCTNGCPSLYFPAWLKIKSDIFFTLFHFTINNIAFLIKAVTEDNGFTLCDSRELLSQADRSVQKRTHCPKDLSRASVEHLPKHQWASATQIPATRLPHPGTETPAPLSPSFPAPVVSNEAKESQHFTLLRRKNQPSFCIIQIKSGNWLLSLQNSSNTLKLTAHGQ